MKDFLGQVLWFGLCAAMVLPAAAQESSPAQAPAQTQPQAPPSAPAPRVQARSQATPQSSVNIDGSEAMFTTMCALLAAGFESDVSAANWPPYRAEMRERLRQQQGPAVDALRQFYKQHELRDPGATLSRYLWFGLVSGPAPDFQPILRRDELPPDVIALVGFSEILSSYYKEQGIAQLWRQVQPIYGREIERMHDSLSQIVYVSTGYLREILDPSRPQRFNIIVEPLVGRITNVRNFGDRYALVLSGGDNVPIDVVRHAFLHFLLDPLPLMYPHVVAVKRPLYDTAAKAPRLAPDLKDDFSSYFAECMVRAVELKLKRMSPGEREAAIRRDDEDGYVLVRPLFTALAKFESTEPSMRLFFPDLVRSFETSAEAKRLATLQFAAADETNAGNELSAEEVARPKKTLPTSVPNDAEAIATLTEGERQIAAKNPRAAEAAFQKVLTKYPEQPRAWFGIGVVAYMDHDAARAKQVFGRLTTGEHAATQDPRVLAWSHIYLARIYDYEGNSSVAKAEYESALAVEGGPVEAKQAAQKALDIAASEKQVARP
ncbi:MAG TPA: tetratricopeptide repeat protein [Methylomirabilota bacterium]|nr:tetratricopeptide repeat protein [Methylomirabilota bacterium]